MANEQFKKLCEQVSSLGYGTPEVIAGMYTAVEIMGARAFEAVNTDPVRINRDKLHFTLEFGGKGGYPALQSVAITLFRELPIRHTLIDGIDTAALCEQMRHINWSIDFFDSEKRESKAGQDPGLLHMSDKAFVAYTKVKRLLASGEAEGIGIGIQLMRKFWLGGNFGRSVGFLDAIALFTPGLRHRFDLHTMPFTMHECYHMLCGRPVCKEAYMVPGGVQPVWHQLDLSQQRSDRNFHMQTFPDFDLDKTLDRLPFPAVQEDKREGAKANLRKGEEIEIAAPDGKGKLHLSVDAAGQSLNIADENRKLIPLEQFLLQDLTRGKEKKSAVKRSKRYSSARNPAGQRRITRKGKNGRSKKR